MASQVQFSFFKAASQRAVSSAFEKALCCFLTSKPFLQLFRADCVFSQSQIFSASFLQGLQALRLSIRNIQINLMVFRLTEIA